MSSQDFGSTAPPRDPTTQTGVADRVMGLFGLRRPAESQLGPEAILPNAWLVLVITLPAANAEARMKTLRTLDSMRAGLLREGAFVMPESTIHRDALERLAEHVTQSGGTADLVYTRSASPTQEARFRSLFDRTARYAEITKTVQSLEAGFGVSDPSAIARVLQKQREELAKVRATDYFPGAACDAAHTAIEEAERAVHALLFPSGVVDTAPEKGSKKKFFRKTWATRAPLWADRLASAWLIRRFIDVEATMQWLEKGQTAPEESVVTFGFEGARFANSSSRLTFEQLIVYFRIRTNPAFARIARVVRALELGESQLPEAQSVQIMLQGARRRTKTEQEYLVEAEKTFDMMYETYLQPAQPK